MVVATLPLIALTTAFLQQEPAAPASPAAPAAPAVRADHFAGVDLFGTTRFTIDEVMARLGDRFPAYEQAWLAQRIEAAVKLKSELEAAVKELGGFAFVDFAVIQYFNAGHPSYLTIDVVEAVDAPRRMAFAPAPTGTFADPGGLLAKYSEYEELSFALLRTDQLTPDPEAAKTTFHAPFGFKHPSLAPYKEPLFAGARAHADELIQILHGDQDPQHRANAAFLLAFTPDGARLVQELVPACKDPSSHVRNNALRVFAETAHHHPEVAIPLEPVLAALDYPTTTDRNKASAILDGLAGRDELKSEIARRAGATLLAMLRLEQPNNHDFAWRILTQVSGESFSERDYEAWAEWLESVQEKRPAR